MGTFLIPSSFAARTRQWPSIIVLCLSIRIGLLIPNSFMLLAIWRTCWSECVRALCGLGFSSWMGKYVIESSIVGLVSLYSRKFHF